MLRRFAYLNESRLHAAKNDVQAPQTEFDSRWGRLQQIVALNRVHRVSQPNNLAQVNQGPLLDTDQALGAKVSERCLLKYLWLRLSGGRIGILSFDFINVRFWNKRPASCVLVLLSSCAGCRTPNDFIDR